MEIVLGIGRLLAFGAVAVALIAWLCSRAFAWSRRAGVVLAAIVAGYCGGVAAILVIGSIDAGDSRDWAESFRPPSSGSSPSV